LAIVLSRKNLCGAIIEANRADASDAATYVTNRSPGTVAPSQSQTPDTRAK